MPFEWASYAVTHPAPYAFAVSAGRAPAPSGPSAPAPSKPSPVITSAIEAFVGEPVAPPAGAVPSKPPEVTYTGAAARVAAPTPRPRPVPPVVLALPSAPPLMRPDIGTRAIETFTPRPRPYLAISPGRPAGIAPGERKLPGPEVRRPSVPAEFRFQETITPQFVKRMGDIGGKDLAEGLRAPFEFLVPKRKEREIAYGVPETGVGFRPVIEFGAGVVYGAATFPASIVALPQTTIDIITKPGKVFEAVVGKATRAPTFFLGEIAGQTLAGYGIGKIAGFAVSKVRARGITTELVAGEYTYADIAGKRIGLARAKAVLLKKKKPIAKFDIETIFQPAKIGEVSPAVSRIMVTKPKPMRLFAAAKGITYPEVSGLYPGISKALIFEKGKAVSAAAAAGITKIEPGIMKTAGISITAPSKAKTVFGSIFREVKPPSPITFFRAGPKVIPKPAVPAVAVTTKAITKAVGKVITKPGPAVTRTGALTGSIAAFVGTRRAPALLEEQEVFVSPRARGVVGVQAMDTRQRAATMQRLGFDQRQAIDTMQRFGVDTRQAPRVGLAVGLGLISRQRIKPMQIQKVALRQEQKMGARFRIPALRMAAPVTIPKAFAPLVIPELDRRKVTRRKKLPKKFKYRTIKHPFPSLKELMGI